MSEYNELLHAQLENQKQVSAYTVCISCLHYYLSFIIDYIESVLFLKTPKRSPPLDSLFFLEFLTIQLKEKIVE